MISFILLSGFAVAVDCPSDISILGPVVDQSLTTYTIVGQFCSVTTFQNACVAAHNLNIVNSPAFLSSVGMACLSEALPAATAFCLDGVTASGCDSDVAVSPSQEQYCQSYCANGSANACSGVTVPAPHCSTSSQYHAPGTIGGESSASINYQGYSYNYLGTPVELSMGGVSCNAELFAHASCTCVPE